jgi:hypothetical protein
MPTTGEPAPVALIAAERILGRKPMQSVLPLGIAGQTSADAICDIHYEFGPPDMRGFTPPGLTRPTVRSPIAEGSLHRSC